MPALRPYSTGSKTVTFVGTGSAGQTIGGGPVIEPKATEKELSTTDHVKGKVLLQGNVVKSVVTHEVNNTSSLDSKGKIGAATKQDTVEKPSKQHTGGALADITVSQDVKMCLVSVSMTTNGICFEDFDD